MKISAARTERTETAFGLDPCRTKGTDFLHKSLDKETGLPSGPLDWLILNEEGALRDSRGRHAAGSLRGSPGTLYDPDVPADSVFANFGKTLARPDSRLLRGMVKISF